jgi:AAA family ATP:ADP antiporter
MRNTASLAVAVLLWGSSPIPSVAQTMAGRAVVPRVDPSVGPVGVKITPSSVVPSLSAVPSLTATPLVNGVVPAPSSIPSAVSVPLAAAARSPSAKPLSAPLASLQTFSAALAPSEGEAPAPRSQRETSELHFSGASLRHETGSLPVLAAASDAPRPSLSPSSPSPEPEPRVPWPRRVRDAMKGDAGRLATAAFLWNFLTIGAYSIIGPARGALLLTKFGPETIPWVYLASAALTGAVVLAYNRVAKKAGRKALIGGSLGLLTLTLAGGALAVAALGSPAASFGYYLWTDVFGIMSVTLFWTYQNDVFKRDEAKRLFGFVAAGAPLGSIAGAFLVKSLVGSLGPVPMLLAAAGVFAAVLPLFLWMERNAKERGAEPAERASGAPAGEGVLRTILKSKFLVFLTALVALERLVPDITNYLYSVVAAQSFAGDPAGLAAFFADVNFWTSIASFAVSSILVGLTIKRLGTAGALMTAGLANLLLFALFPFAPSLALVGVFFGLDGVSRYTWFKTAKETTYSATDKDVIYRVKAFVEMFVYRFARGLAGFLLLAAAALGWGASTVAWLGAPLALLWLYCAWAVGREHAGLDAAKKAAGR